MLFLANCVIPLCYMLSASITQTLTVYLNSCLKIQNLSIALSRMFICYEELVVKLYTATIACELFPLKPTKYKFQIQFDTDI